MKVKWLDMDRMKIKATALALNKMFRSNGGYGRHYFSICVVNQCMEVMGSSKTKDYETLNLYHCVDFSEMDKETKDWVFRVTFENVFNGQDFPEIQVVDTDTIESKQAIKIAKKTQPIMKRIFG